MSKEVETSEVVLSAQSDRALKPKHTGRAKHLKPYWFKPGQSGNPGGKDTGPKRKLAELREQFLNLVPQAQERLLELVASQDETIALQAAQFVFLYAFGKPQEGRDLAHLEAMRARMTEIIGVPV